MNTWKKVGDAWAVQCDQAQQPGDVVTVVNRAGKAKQITLGERTRHLGFVYLTAAPKPFPAETIGNVTGIIALFDRAAQNLKYPAVVLNVPEMDNTQDTEGFTLRLTVAGERAKVPGSINVTSEGSFESRDWFGRITRQGEFQPARAANGRTDIIARRLREFAAEPARIASEHGRLTGRCCFCNLALKDERSTAVGYGAICASHYGLPWGAKS